jgi:hypothetical protein
MAFWNTDLTTPDGAEGAAQTGGFACLLGAALGVFGLLFATGLLAEARSAVSLLFFVPLLVEIALLAIAGFRLRAGKGLIWGSVAALLILLELVGKLLVLNIVGIVINGVLLVGIVNGVCGAWALRRGGFDTEEVAAVFE